MDGVFRVLGKRILLGLAATLGTSAALDSLGFGALDVVGWDPIFVVRLPGGDSWAFRIRCHLSSGVGFFGHLRTFAALGGFALLGEVGDDPDGVEEVSDRDGAGEEEEVKEEAGGELVRGVESSEVKRLTVEGQRC